MSAKDTIREILIEIDHGLIGKDNPTLVELRDFLLPKFGEDFKAYRKALEQYGMIHACSENEKVMNVLKTSNEPHQVDGGWNEYWTRISHLKFPVECRNVCCHGEIDEREEEDKEVVGAHVRLDGEPSHDHWAWIAPLCKSCNGQDSAAKFLAKGTILVRVKMKYIHDTAQEEHRSGVANSD